MVSHTETAQPQAMPVVRLWWFLAIVLASLCVALLLLTGWREWTLGQLGAHSFPGLRSTPPTGSFLAFTAGLAVLGVGVAASARRHPRKWRRRVLLGMALLILASAGVAVAGTRAAGEARTCHRSAVTTVTAFATGLGLECMRMIPSGETAAALGAEASTTFIWLEDVPDARIVLDPATGAVQQIGSNAFDGWRPVDGR